MRRAIRSYLQTESKLEGKVMQLIEALVTRLPNSVIYEITPDREQQPLSYRAIESIATLKQYQFRSGVVWGRSLTAKENEGFTEYEFGQLKKCPQKKKRSNINLIPIETAIPAAGAALFPFIGLPPLLSDPQACTYYAVTMGLPMPIIPVTTENDTKTQMVRTDSTSHNNISNTVQNQPMVVSIPLPNESVSTASQLPTMSVHDQTYPHLSHNTSTETHVHVYAELIRPSLFVRFEPSREISSAAKTWHRRTV